MKKNVLTCYIKMFNFQICISKKGTFKNNNFITYCTQKVYLYLTKHIWFVKGVWSFFQEMEDILNEEMNKTFDCYSSLMVIIISGGFTTNSRSFIYGTDNSCIDYTLIRTRFEQVESLKGKPKVFIIDDIEYCKLFNSCSHGN